MKCGGGTAGKIAFYNYFPSSVQEKKLVKK
jgi:hypothetical protein